MLSEGFNFFVSSALATEMHLGQEGIFGSNFDTALATLQAVPNTPKLISDTIDVYLLTRDLSKKQALRHALAGLVRQNGRDMERILAQTDFTSLVKNVRRFQPNSDFVFAQASADGEREALHTASEDGRVCAPSKKGAKKTSAIDRQRALFHKHLNLPLSLLKTLDKEGLNLLHALVTHGPRKMQLTLKVLKAVHETSPGREKEVLKKLAVYPGSLAILEGFLMDVRTFDPFVATKVAQVVILPISSLPVQSRQRDENRETVRGQSGHLLKGLVYCVFDPASPPTTIGYFSKRQAVSRPFETFSPDRFDPVRIKKIKERRHKRIRGYEKDITMAELEAFPELIDTIKSPIIARDLTVYRELKEAIRRYKAELESMAYGPDVILSTIKGLKVRTDPGGQIFGWYDRQMEADIEIPEGIRMAIASLRNPDVDLTPNQESFYIAGVLAYQRLHSYISKKAALSGAASDVEEYEKLDLTDPFRNENILSEKRTLQEAAAQGSDEISVADFSRVLSLAALRNVRRQMNRRHEERYGKDFQEALEYFKSVAFQENGAFHEDVLSEAVPMTRLRQTPLGKILGRKDFKRVLDTLFLNAVTKGNPEYRQTAMPIAQYREWVDGLVIAYRKAKAGNVTGNDLRLAEDFDEKLSLEELIRRFKENGLLGHKDFYKNKDRILKEAQAGLFSLELKEILQTAARLAAGYKTSSEVRNDLETVKTMLANPFVEMMWPRLNGWLDKNYFTQEEIALIGEFTLFKAKFDAMRLGEVSDMEAIREKMHICNASVFYEKGNGINLHRQSFELLANRQQEGKIFFYDPEQVRSALTKIEAEFIRSDSEELPPEWLAKAKFLCSRRAEGILRAQGMSLVDYETYRVIQKMNGSSSIIYFSRQFIEAIMAIDIP
ncbi:MAG: hypothetical protein Q7T03_06515 [Deltaproteobacteria bacterium]|nr:hypothetical protein [Deltaproteobacteria bacterium]